VRRIDNQRRSSRLHDSRSGIEPKLIVRTGVALGRRFIHAVSGGASFDIGGFLFGKKLSSGKLRRTLEWRDGGVGPDSLQVRLAVRSSGRSPYFCRGFWRCRSSLLTGRYKLRSESENDDEREFTASRKERQATSRRGRSSCHP